MKRRNISTDRDEVIVNLQEKPELLSKLEIICKRIFVKVDLKAKKQTFSKDLKNAALKWHRFTCKTQDILRILSGCLISHRFQEAARILEHMTPTVALRTHAIYAKNCMFVLENLKEETTRDITEFFVRHVTVLHEINKRELVLEYLLYKLRNNEFDLPVDLVQNVLAGGLNLRKNAIIDPILEGYTTLLDYIIWARKVQLISTGDSNALEESQNVSEKVISSWSSVITKPGIWDIFLEKLIQVLLWKYDHTKCEEVLRNYVETHPTHLNAYVYLEVYREEVSVGERSKNLKKIADMSPSDELVLDYVQFLLSENNVPEALKRVFLFLDYSVNKESLPGWTTLAKIANLILERSSSHEEKSPMLALKKLWKERCTYWIQYHFDVPSVDFESRHQLELCFHKSIFLCIMLKSRDHTFIQKTCQNMAVSHPIKLKELENVLEEIQRFNKLLFL